jgi:hypothetical protein
VNDDILVGNLELLFEPRDVGPEVHVESWLDTSPLRDELKQFSQDGAFTLNQERFGPGSGKNACSRKFLKYAVVANVRMSDSVVVCIASPSLQSLELTHNSSV